MRPLQLLGVMLIIAGLMLIISSMIKPIVVGGEGEANVTGCVIILFIPICFSGKGVMMYLPLIVGLVAIVIMVALFLFFMYKLLKMTQHYGPYT